MRNKRFFTGIAIAIILAGSVLVNVSQGVAASQLTDIEHHWAASHIQTMIDEGMVSGYPDHTFKPDNAVNRAEFVTLVNHVFHFTAIAATGFLDVAATDWFAEEIAKAKSAGYLNGYEDGTVKPGQRITRQEAAVMIARAVGLEAGSAQELAGFQDAGEIPAWSQGALAALVGRDCIKGYPDGTIQAGKTVSRAEAAVMLHKAAAYAATSPAQQPIGSDWSNLDKAGSYGPASGQQEVSSDVIITAADVTLQNVIIQGDLLISAAVGNGDVTLQKVTVTGTATIEGGGEDTVTIDNCVLGQTIINKAGGKVRLCLSGNTIIAELVARSGVKVEGQARIDKAVIRSANVVIETQPGSSEIASGLSASVGGKTVSARRSGGSGGSSANANIPAEVESMVVNELLGNTYVTVNLKADAAEAADKVLINGMEAHSGDGLVYRKTLPGSISRSAIVVAVHKIAGEEATVPPLIMENGSSLTYQQELDQTSVVVETIAAVTAVTANEIALSMIEGKWQGELAGEVPSVTVVAFDGNNNETLVLTTGK